MRTIILCLLLFPLFCFAQQKERYPSSVLINGSLDCSGRMMSADVVQALGLYDSLVRNGNQCGNFLTAEDSLIYYHNIVFEKNVDTFTFQQMEFFTARKAFVQFGNINLTARTTQEEIEAIYNLTYDNNVGGADAYINGKKAVVAVIDVMGAKDNNTKWYLWFCDDRLVRLQLWVGC